LGSYRVDAAENMHVASLCYVVEALSHISAVTIKHCSTVETRILPLDTDTVTLAVTSGNYLPLHSNSSAPNFSRHPHDQTPNRGV